MVDKHNSVDVYLLHFEPALRHARHYMGSAEDVEKRVQQHLCGQGSPLVKAAALAGCKVTVVRVWKGGGRELEAKLKNIQHNADYCPVCRKKKGKKPR